MLNQDYSGNGAAAFPYDEDTSYVSHIKIPIEPLNFTEFPGSEIRPKYNNKSQAYASMENTVSTPKQYPKTRFNDLASSPDFASLKKLDAHPEPPKYLNNTGGNFELDFKDTEEVLKKSEHRDYKVMDQQEKTKQSSKEKKRHKQAGQKKNNNAKQRKNKKASKKDEPAKQRKKQRNTGPKKKRNKPKKNNNNNNASMTIQSTTEFEQSLPVSSPSYPSTPVVGNNRTHSAHNSRKRKLRQSSITSKQSGSYTKQKISHHASSSSSSSSSNTPITKTPTPTPTTNSTIWRTQFKNILDCIRKEKKYNYEIFWEPVHEKEHDAPNYYDYIDYPMDFGTIGKQLRDGETYKSVNQVLLDIELVLFNARLYNPPGNYVHDESKKIQKYMTKTDKRLHKIVQKYGTEADKNVWRDRYGLGDYGPFALDEDFLGDFITVIE